MACGFSYPKDLNPVLLALRMCDRVQFELLVYWCITLGKDEAICRTVSVRVPFIIHVV